MLHKKYFVILIKLKWFWLILDSSCLMYDIVADCSDNVPTRYLVNDACVLSGKPLVSASALRMEGQVGCGDILVPPHYTQFNEIYCIIVCVSVCVCKQLTVYNYCGGPCYRCLYPLPPPPETVTNCSDGGVLGVGEFFPPSLSYFYLKQLSLWM